MYNLYRFDKNSDKKDFSNCSLFAKVQDWIFILIKKRPFESLYLYFSVKVSEINSDVNNYKYRLSDELFSFLNL